MRTLLWIEQTREQMAASLAEAGIDVTSLLRKIPLTIEIIKKNF